VENVSERKVAEEALVKSNQQLETVLSQLKATQAQVVQQERLSALGTMASGIAHDFNNALAAILGFSELLLHRPELLNDAEKTRRYLTMMNTAAKDAGTVVSRLREFYRHREEGEVFGAVDLRHLAEQAVSLTQPRWQAQAQASGSNITVQTELASVPSIAGNSAELREALTNLIINAVDAMPQGGTLTLRTRADAEQCYVTVADTGTGMTEEVRQRCFEPFFSTKGTRGTGLGLSMVYGIIQRHRGDVQIESRLGVGTKFIIRLPVARNISPATETAAPAAVTQPLRILLIDDEEMVRNIVRDLLQSDGHEVRLAKDGREGLACFHQGAYDVVFVDRAMPGMSGDQVAAAIKSLTAEIPVVLLTGFGTLMNSAGEQPAGVDFVLSKPVTLAELRAALARAMGQRPTPPAVTTR
jgi:nitrogen-specific signal transduction histidine kinase/ActR/RegA family two-component response regulator